MDTRSRLVVGCALLACALVAARTEPQSNFIEKATTKTTETQRTLPLSIEDSGALDTQDIPVNERYPHAVLFGATCGGTIIGPKWILTAAHCTLFTGGRMVLAGTNNSENDSGVTRRVKRLEVHPLFSVGPHWLDPEQYHIKQVAARWDFMLAELEEALPLNNKTIKAASLDNGPPIREGILTAFAGYGAKNHGETMRHHMHAMELVTLSDDKCGELTQYNPMDMLCARGRPPNYDTACNTVISKLQGSQTSTHYVPTVGTRVFSRSGESMGYNPHVGPVRFGGYHMSSNFVVLGHAGFLTMFSFTVIKGDSGSGLVDESGHLLGVASWVENDATECRNGNKIVFSRVESVRDWIRQVTSI